MKSERGRANGHRPSGGNRALPPGESRRAGAHAGHDELLIARLYGHDLEGRELALARERVAGCPQCADLLAELSAIATATRSMAVPALPRDFSLTEQQAGERPASPAGSAGPSGWRLGGLRRPGLGRSLGVSLAAAGLVGALVVGSVTLLATPGDHTSSRDGFNAAAPQEQLGAGSITDTSATAGPMVAAAATPAGGGASVPLAPLASPEVAGSPVPSVQTAPTLGVGIVTPTRGPAEPSARPAAIGTGSSGKSVSDNGAGEPVANPSAGLSVQEAPESTLPPQAGWLVAFGILFLAGLVILLTPSIWRRWRRRP